MKKAGILLSLVLALLLMCVMAQAETTTTVLMYMCGTDLQSDCIQDMYEMSTPVLPDSIQVVVQAGGAKQWDDAALTPNAINRFTIRNNDWEDMQVIKSTSMGDPETLYNFLAWAVPAYPADRYVLVLWDHGGGSADGICFDETANDDGLTIHDVYQALYDYQQENADFRLDILGCDACLMATYEMAAHMRWYADYMVASEELEPYLGWNYLGWLSALADNPDMDSQSLGVAIADAFMEACLADNPDDYVSQSVIYLPAMAYLTDKMEAYSQYLVQALQNGQLSTVSRARQRMYAFGSFADSSTDMVDFMAFLDATRQFAPNTADMVESAYKKAVRYTVGTDKFEYLTGMSILLPYNTVANLGEDFSGYGCSETIPNYSDFVAGCVTMLNGADYNFTAQAPSQMDSAVSQAVFTGNMQSTVFMPSGTFVAEETEEDTTEPEEDVTADLPEVESTLTDTVGTVIGAIAPPQGEETETFQTPSNSDAAYAYSMTLSADELANLSLVEGLLYMDASDEEDTIYVEMGAMQNAGINWETGDIVSEFDGTWPMLDEQLVVIYDQTVTSGMKRSIIPVKCNDVDGYLLLTFTTAHPEGIINGFSRGYDENGHPVRGTTQLKEGDVIIPTYPMLYEDEDGEMQDATFDGDAITVGADGTIPFEYVSLEGSETKYLYCFCLTDIFGGTQLSEFIEFEL